MADEHNHRRGLIQHESSDLSESPTIVDASPPTPAHITSPIAPILRNRPGYTRINSVPEEEFQRKRARTLPVQDEEGEDIADTFQARERSGSQGLGIGMTHGSGVSPAGSSPKERRVSLGGAYRVPVGSKSPPVGTPLGTPFGSKTPGSGDPLIGSPKNFQHITGFNPSFTSSNTAYEGASAKYDPPLAKTRGHASQSSLSTFNSVQDPYEYSDTARLTRNAAGTSIKSAKSAYNTSFQPEHDCKTHGHFFQSRANWLNITIMILSIFSTIFSGIFVIIALKGFRYGKAIRSNGGKVSFATVSILVAVFAKAIELSFTTAFVAWLGQVVSRRAFIKRGKGVTLAELNMRNWIMQPGTMITHFETVRYAALSVLGTIALLAAFVGMLYTTAADALVQPQLQFGPWEHKHLQSTVMASFANSPYLQTRCATPIMNDPEAAGGTCLQIEHASQAYHNYEKYVTEWAEIARNGSGSKIQKERPPGFALLNENVTVTASWINVVDMKNVSDAYGGRVINNVSLAFPHANVWKSAKDDNNGIVQPEELDGLGRFEIKASVPSPVIHSLCVNLDRKELAPLIYTEWPEQNTTRAFNQSLDIIGTWPSYYSTPRINNFSVTTVVDDIFKWGEKYNRRQPVFAKYPLDYNTILNHTGQYGRDAIYILAKAAATANYTICQLQTTMTGVCSTEYSAQGGVSASGHLFANCEDDDDPMAYDKEVKNAGALDLAKPSKDWPDIAHEMSNALSLNAGISDGNASNARLLTQFILAQPELNAALPSMAEAMAVLSGCTLLMSTMDAPFSMYWNYTSLILQDPAVQWFNATLRAQEYASGGVYQYQKGFHVVLMAVFVTNVLVLSYFLFHRGLVTDYSEPPNLFSLAVNSPYSEHLSGSCGAGPHGEQYKVAWRVNHEGEHLFMESEKEPLLGQERKSWVGTLRERVSGKGGDDSDDEVEMGGLRGSGGGGGLGGNVHRMYEHLSKRRSML